MNEYLHLHSRPSYASGIAALRQLCLLEMWLDRSSSVLGGVSRIHSQARRLKSLKRCSVRAPRVACGNNNGYCIGSYKVLRIGTGIGEASEARCT